MIEVLRSHISTKPAEQKLNVLREYLQWLILQALDDSGYRQKLSFTGGTCLRVVYGINRFSEDLDFSLVQKQGFNLRDLHEALLRRLTLMGIKPESSPFKDHNTVVSFFLRFGGLLHPLGLSALKNEKLAIKFEVDTHPPSGANVIEYLFQDPIVFMINHFDLPSLFTTKLHALLFRGYDKGRDYYDLFYFLRKKTMPTLTLFQAAVKQTNPGLKFPTMDSIFECVREKLNGMDEKNILRDVSPFLLDSGEQRFLKRTVLLKSLEQAFQK